MEEESTLNAFTKRFFRRTSYYIRGIFVPVFLHMLMIIVMLVYIYIGFWISDFQMEIDPVKKYGILLASVLYFLRIPILLSIPFNIFNFLGLVLFSPFKGNAEVNIVSRCGKFVCFRVVTRGLYPELVKTNVERNMETCQKCNVQNFKFEVVTDVAIGLPKCHRIREIVVPTGYKTANGTLFKARALNYCLQPDVNILSADDWIVHLDEETILTDDSINGIFQFISHSKADVGQGPITYGKEEIVNLFTTLADGVRVACDFGMMRTCLGLLHRPVLGFKGSYIVTKNAVEEDVTFDFAPQCSIAEDLFFALRAWEKGYSFDFINGEMLEKSAFSTSDFVKQRTRWFIGHYHILWNSDIPVYCVLGIFSTNLSSVLMILSIICVPTSFFVPLPLPRLINVFLGLIFGMSSFGFLIGNYLQLQSRRRGKCFQPIILAVVSQLLVPIFGILEAYAALAGFYGRNSLTFHIVKKEIRESFPNSTRA